MKFLIELITISLAVVLIMGQDDKIPINLREDEVPKLPLAYYAVVQINSKGITRNNGRSRSQTSVREYITDSFYNVVNIYEGGMIIREFFDKKRDQLIRVAGPSFRKMNMTCIVQSLSETGDYELSTYPDKNIPINGADLYFRFRGADNKVVQKRQLLGRDEQYSIPVKVYYEEIDWPSANAKIKLTYTWSDNSTWVPIAGQDKKQKTYSVPVSIRVQADGKFGNIDDEVIVTEFYPDVQPNPDSFSIPDGVYCPNLKKMGLVLPDLPTHFSFIIEIVTKNVSSVMEPNMVFYQTRYFDSELKVTRIDLNPNVKHINDENKLDTQSAVVTTIHDFTTDRSFTIDRSTGKCIVGVIPIVSDDVEEHISHLKISHPLKFIGLEGYDFTWYKQTYERGIKAEQYRAYNDRTNLVGEVLISSASDEFQGDNLWDHQHPIKITEYYLNEPESATRIELNIFKFDKARPSIFLYDTTDCFTGNDRRRFQFQIYGSIQELQLDSEEAFKYNILVYLVENTLVAPLRITHIDMNSRDDITYITFTILEKVNVGDTSIVPTDELATDKAIENLRSHIDSKFAQKYIVVNNKYDLTYAKPGSLIELDQLGTINEIHTSGNPIISDTSTTKRTTNQATETTLTSGENVANKENELKDTSNIQPGYSSGSMAALGICMLLIGSFGTYGILYYFKPRVFQSNTHSTPMKRFVNDEKY